MQLGIVFPHHEIGGSAPALLKRCAMLGDGWFPLGEPNEACAAGEHFDAVGELAAA